ncbi:hypothetical protein K466DRAFT_607698 [Polyporus arcularius HHB13444]|uniref:Uncharacterized protein n=1 Tax=Polyporus arcularius HHB13444 TaxID=1314778 RepID=A0A5C3NPB4_9APHY|nr:hypothetical protein K466DRAFT_607698 [Polyporus arcularius HHB13444]
MPRLFRFPYAACSRLLGHRYPGSAALLDKIPGYDAACAPSDLLRIDDYLSGFSVGRTPDAENSPQSDSFWVSFAISAA